MTEIDGWVIAAGLLGVAVGYAYAWIMHVAPARQMMRAMLEEEDRNRERA